MGLVVANRFFEKVAELKILEVELFGSELGRAHPRMSFDVSKKVAGSFFDLHQIAPVLFELQFHEPFKISADPDLQLFILALLLFCFVRGFLLLLSQFHRRVELCDFPAIGPLPSPQLQIPGWSVVKLEPAQLLPQPVLEQVDAKPDFRAPGLPALAEVPPPRLPPLPRVLRRLVFEIEIPDFGSFRVLASDLEECIFRIPVFAGFAPRLLLLRNARPVEFAEAVDDAFDLPH